MKRICKIAIVVLSVVLIGSQALFAGGGKEQGVGSDGVRTTPLKISFGKLGNDSHFDNQRPFATYMMELVEKYSDGMITFDYYPNGQLGGEPDMLDQIISGDLDVAMLSEGTFSAVTPEVSMSLLPFLFESSEEFMAVAGLESGTSYQKELVKAVDNYGLFKFIGPVNGVFRALANRKHEIKSINDFRNVTFRVQPGVIYTDSYSALGASTASIAFGELYAALQQGAVDGEDLSLPFFYNYKFYEVERFSSEVRLFFQTINLIVSEDCWNKKFTEADRQVFMKAVTEAQKLGMADQTDMDEEVFKMIEETGVKITRYSDIPKAEVEKMRNAVAPVWDKHAKVNMTVWNALQDSLKAYRNK
ncbi:MAG: TRAP transporter substrate-binding protein [Sphaerochaetaceae bacterium]